MNELDRTLHDAFQSRHVPHDITPSLVDVRWRARRRHTRRNAALVGCAAITGAGAVAVLATRHPGEQNGVGAGTGAGGDATASTIACYSFPTTTTMPPTTVSGIAVPESTVYTIQSGDNPNAVSRRFNVPLELLDAVNRDNPDYAAFVPGANIVIPTTTVLFPSTQSTGPETFQVPCDPVGGQGEWHCTDLVGTDEFGRDVFLSCEQQFTGIVPTTTSAAVLPTVSTVEVPSPTTTNTIPVQLVGGDSTTTTSLG